MEKIKFKALNCAANKEKVYFASSEGNMVLVFDADNKSITILDGVPNEEMFGEFLYGNIVFYNNKLFLAPLHAEEIAIYEFEKKNWLKLECPTKISKSYGKFFGVVGYSDSVYLLGHKYPGILKINSETYEMEQLRIEKDIFECNYIEDGFLNWDYVIKDGCLYTPVLCSNKVLKINLDSDKVDFISIGSKENKYVGLAWDGEYFWLAPRKGSTYVRWNGEKEVIEYNLPEEFSAEINYFGGALVEGDNIIFTSFVGKTLKFNKKAPDKPVVINQVLMFGTAINERRYMTQDEMGNIFYLEKGSITPVKYDFDKTVLDDFVNNKYIKDGILSSEIMTERKEFSLNNFINSVNILDNKHERRNVAVGKSTYKILVEDC